MKDLIEFLNRIFKSKVLLLGFLIYFLFNISALKTHWFDYFFFGSSVHYCCQGLDFYGIPNGVYSFTHGGNLSGDNLPKEIKPYSEEHTSNPNDYHPLTSLSIGSFLILFNPEKSFYVWTIVKIFITLITSYYIFKNFKNYKHINFSLFIFLTNFSQYNEIRISQYQFLFNISLIYFITTIIKNKNNFEGGIIYFISLIAKPISLLWIPLLILKRRITIATIGVFLFTISTLTFYIMGIGEHFVNNLFHHIFNPRIPDSIDFMSLDALIRSFFHVKGDEIKILKIIFLFLIYLISINKKTHILTPIFLLSVYFLFFYDNLFQYHFSILGPILSMCILLLPNFQLRISKFLIILISLPTIFFILRFLNIEFNFDPTYGPNPTLVGWQIVSFFQLLPIAILSVIIYLKELLEIPQKIKNQYDN